MTRVSNSKINLRQNDYTSHSTTYEQKRFAGRSNEYLEMLRQRAVLKGIGNRPLHSRILDVGCGTGRGLRYLAAAGFRHITGLDYTWAMLEIARNQLWEQDLHSHVQLVRGDAFMLPGGEDAFDVVLSLNFLHMFDLELQKQIVCEMSRVCRPEGLLLAEFESIHKGFFVTRYLEQRRVKHRTKFNSIWDIPRIFPAEQFSNVRVLGTALPMAYRLLSRTPRLGSQLERITFLPPFNWMAERIVVTATRR